MSDHYGAHSTANPSENYRGSSTYNSSRSTGRAIDHAPTRLPNAPFDSGSSMGNHPRNHLASATYNRNDPFDSSYSIANPRNLPVSPTKNRSFSPPKAQSSIGAANYYVPPPRLPNAPLGMKNFGNSCYIASSLQALMACEEFFQWASDQKRDQKRDQKHTTQTFAALLHEFTQEHIHLLQQTHSDLLVSDWLRQCECLDEAAKYTGRQKDAERFTTALLKSIDRELQQQPSPRISLGLLGGKTRFYCTDGQFQPHPEVIEDFYVLPLEIGDGGLDVEGALTKTFAPRSIRRGVMVGDQMSSRQTTSSRQLFLYNLPKLLIVQLKCFEFDGRGALRKVKRPVSVKPHALRIKTEMIDEEMRPKYPGGQLYRLIATVSHSGIDMNSGHYIAQVHRNGEWFTADDGAVFRDFDQRYLKEFTPYLLFYEKIRL